MTSRLEEAIKKLDPQSLEQVTQLAESLAAHRAPDNRPPAKLTWIGCLRDAPEKDGVEMAHRTNEIRSSLLEKGLPK
jgi:hypothetical protein